MNRKVYVGGRLYHVIGMFKCLEVNGNPSEPMLVCQELPGLPIVHVRVKDAQPYKTVPPARKYSRF